jgi:hypothetical protein
MMMMIVMNNGDEKDGYSDHVDDCVITSWRAPSPVI